ncbi:mono/diheme cytochrome c family protein [Pontibacter aydingkolensis]|uniref:Cytochrome c n=1 Tax=Pontibacter aydingkolensis TaxID=1911536 RepID=A0ABS7CYP4_9BACT|nr:c-type cytochrome [Pontibacter aydingkolensis]MBW7468974.1 cytochrome c [Pontibacter aydingkolensis]
MKKALKVLGIVVVAIVSIAAAGILYMQYAFPNVDAAPTISINKTPALIERGDYLANHVAVCIDCHSERDWSKFGGPIKPGTEGRGGDIFDHTIGFPGTFYAKNITPDKETGLGNWTDGEIYRAMTKGVSKNGDPLFPVMPYNSFNQMSKQDAYAIIAYIRTLKPVKYKVADSDPDFPMNLIMRTMPLKEDANIEEAAITDEVLKGKYLLTIASCAECHTPAVKGKPVEGKYLAGGFEFPFPNGAVVRSANITPDKQTGIGTWTEDMFVQRFKAYNTPEAAKQKVSPDEMNTVMPWAMYAGMKDEDLRAIYKYLKTLEPNKNKIERFTPAPKKS